MKAESAQAGASKPPHDHHRWHAGYSVLAVATVAQLLTAPGQTLLVSLLNVPLREAFDIGALTLNTAYAVATIAGSLPLVWVGRLTDRIGPRRAMILVALAFGGGCLFTAGVLHPAMVFVAFFLLRFLGQGALSMVSGHAVAMWFHTRLGRMEGIRTIALFAGGAPLPTLTLALMAAIGWRATWAAFGIFVAVVVSLLAWRWLIDRPEDVGLGLDGATCQTDHAQGQHTEPGLSLPEALQTRSFWLLALVTTIPPMVGTAVMFDIQPLLDERDLDAEAAALAIGLWSATLAVLAIPAGVLVDRLRPRLLLAVSTLGIGASCVLLLYVHTLATVIMATTLMAFGQSLAGPTVHATAARYFGRRHHGAIRSWLTRVSIIATGVGPFVFGLSQHQTGGYAAALLIFAGTCSLIAAASLGLVPPTGGGLAGRSAKD